MLPVLDLDPVRRPASRDKDSRGVSRPTFQAHQAGMPEQVRADLALLEVAQEDPVHAPRQEPGQVGLAHRQRQPAEVLAVADQDVEGVELDLGIVLAGVQPLKSDRPSTPSSTASPSITKDELRLRSAASVISGKRSLQSWPLRVNSRTRLPSR